VTNDEALRAAKELGKFRAFSIRGHAFDRMEERNADQKDIANALLTATKASHEERNKWKFSGGVDREGVALGVVVAFDWRTEVITIF